MADDWLGISSAEYDSSCGNEVGFPVTGALDGNSYWQHTADEVHWFILDLGQTYTIKKVRGRSTSSDDPIDVNIYIDDNNPPTTLCEEGITTWAGTYDWVEITLTTEGTGRYVKVEIEDTEDPARTILWYCWTTGYETIFDAYGDVAGGVEHTHTAADTITISDSIATASVMKHAKTDTMTIGDAIGTVSVMKQALADTMNISDALLVSQGFRVAFADTMNISDSLAAELIAVEVKRRMGIARKIGSPTAQNIGVGL